MKAIILAAGYATRLYPLTLNSPKSLLKVGVKTVLDYIMEDIEKVDIINEVIIISNNKFYENFINWKECAKYHKTINVINDGTSSDEDKLGAIGDINLVINECKIDEDVFVIAGDNLYSFSLQGFFEKFNSVKKNCILAKKVEEMKELKRMGVVQVDRGNNVIGLEEKPDNPKSNLAVFAAYIYLKETIPLFGEYIRQGNNPDAPGYFPAWLYKRKDIYTYIVDGDCYDIGTHETYKEVQKKFAAKCVR